MTEIDRIQDPGYPDDVVGGARRRGVRVLDIGSGAGGADVLLVQEHGAGTETGIDVEQRLVDRAARARDRGSA